MKKVIGLAALAATTLLMTGCVQKATIKALKPAKIHGLASKREIAVLPMKNDHVGLSAGIETRLAGYRIDGKNYFTVVDRTTMNKIIAEQKLQTSDLVNSETSTELGKLIGAKALITGTVGSATQSDSRFNESRQRCYAVGKKLKCVPYSVSCHKRTVGMAASIKVVDVSTGSIFYGDTLSNQITKKHCSDDSVMLPSKAEGASQISAWIAETFKNMAVPRYVTFKVPLIESVKEVELTKVQKMNFDIGLKYIKQNRYDKADKIFMKLFNETGNRSYSIAYNAGLMKEALGKIMEAREIYKIADNLMVEPVEEISEAMKRIEGSVADYKKAQEQLNANKKK